MNAPPELIPSALKMLSALAAVVGGLLLAIYALRRFQRSGSRAAKQRLIRVLATHYLGVKKSVALVEVPGSLLVLGVSSERIQLLTRITDPQVIESIRDREPQAASSFYDHLSQLTSRMKAESDAS
jgi:flagellar biosynthetic protein FliO